MTKKLNKLIPEEYPEDYKGYRFISLIKYNEKSQITIIDNIVSDIIYAFVLDECNPLNLNEMVLIGHAIDWFEKYSTEIPFSIFLSRQKIDEDYYKVVKGFPVDYVSRVLGPLFKYEMGSPIKIRRKRKKEIQDNIEVVFKQKILLQNGSFNV